MSLPLVHWFRRRLSQSSGICKTAKKKAPRPGRQWRLLLEPLEERVVPSTVTWINSGSGAWDNGNNWSSGSVPGASDNVVISTSANATITVQSGDTESVNSITTLAATDTLSITGGSLTVAASSTLAETLSMSGGSLTVTGLGATFLEDGTTTMTGGSLYAEAGATLSLPNLTSFTETNSDSTFEATGLSSVLNLSALTTLGSMTGTWNVDALAGGTVNLSGLTAIDQPNASVLFEADGSNSLLNISEVTSINAGGSSPQSDLQVTDSETVDAPVLITFVDTDITLDGTGSIATSQWTNFVDGGTITVTGGTVALTGLTNLTGEGLVAENGGTLTLTSLTDYTVGAYQTTFEATGANSTLNLSALTTLGTMTHTWTVEALAGGTLNLSGLTTINEPYATVVVEADGTNSQLNLSGLTSITGLTAITGHSANPHSKFQVTNHASVLATLLTTFGSIDIALDGTGSIATSQWASFTGGGTITVTGGTVSLSGLTDLNDSNLLVESGGTLSLSNLSNYTETDGSTFEATGANSTLDLSGLITFGTMTGTWTVEALAGGTLNLSGMTTINLPDTTVLIEADGTNSLLNLSSLTSMSGGGTFGLQVTNKATVETSTLAFNDIAITLDGTGTIPVSQWTTLTDGSITVTGGTVTLTGMTNVNGSSLFVEKGGTLSLPNLTYYTETDGATFEATDATLNLLGLTTLGSMTGTWTVEALAGGWMNLWNLPTIDEPNATLDFYSDAKSILWITYLTSMTGGAGSTFTDDGGILGASYLIAFSGVLVSDPNSPIITTTSLGNGFQNVFYYEALTEQNWTGYGYFSVEPGTSLPPGLSLDPASGLISGYPTTLGTYTFTLVATDSLSHTGSKSFTITISPTFAFRAGI